MASNNFTDIFELVRDGEMANTQPTDRIRGSVKWRNKRKRRFNRVIRRRDYLEDEVERMQPLRELSTIYIFVFDIR